jgi:hypothetical protein
MYNPKHLTVDYINKFKLKDIKNFYKEYDIDFKKEEIQKIGMWKAKQILMEKLVRILVITN